MSELTQGYLKELLDYDEDSGVFVWKARCIDDFSHCGDPRSKMMTWNTRLAGTQAGSLSPAGYVYIKINNKSYKAHRLAWLYMHGYTPELILDHIDRDRCNNKINNLREVSHQCNIRNCSISSNNKSGVTGVSWNQARGKWVAHLKPSGKRVHLGFHVNFKDAVRARWEAEVKYDFPNCNTISTSYLYLKEHDLLSE